MGLLAARLTVALALAVLVALAAGDASACSCYGRASFRVAAPRAALVIRAEILVHGGGTDADPNTFMDVRVDEVLRGSTAAKTVRVFGSNGFNCGAWLANYEDGTSWLLALRPLEREPGDVGAVEPWLMSGCAHLGALVEGELVRTDAEVMSLFEVRELVSPRPPSRTPSPRVAAPAPAPPDL